MSRTLIITIGTLIGGVIVYVASTTLLGIVGKEPWMSIALFASLIMVGLLMGWLTRGMAPAPVVNLTLEEMEQRGMLTREKYEATRAFQVEEFEDEGCQYFIDLKDGRVLFLCGQYLYDYEPADGKWQKQQARKFPCTEFTVLRNTEHGDVADVICGGSVLEPEGEAPSFGGKGDNPSDGEIISDRTYDEIKFAMMKAKRS